MPRGVFRLGVDLGGTYLRMGLARDAELVSQRVLPSAQLPRCGAQEALGDLLAEYRDACGEELACVSVGVPGSVNADRRTVFCTPNLTGAESFLFESADLASPLEKRLGVPVYVSKDVNNLLRADRLMVPGWETKTVAAVYIGTGYGGAVSMRGELVEGTSGVAMDIGHIPFFHGTRMCGCGKAGCAEAYASGRRLLALREERFPETAVEELFLKHGEDPEIDEFVYACALPLATMAGIFAPDALIVGGGVVEMKGFPRERFERFVLEQTTRAVRSVSPVFLYPKPFPGKGVLGAVLLARQLEENVGRTPAAAGAKWEEGL